MANVDPTASVWDPRPAPSGEHAPLEGDSTADVTVIGAGIAGLTTALLLARRGLRVVVLEALHVGAGTTGRSTAKVSALQGLQYQRVTEAHGVGIARRYAEAQVAGRDGIEQAIADEAITCGWEQRRAVTFAFGDDGVRAVEDEHRAATDAGLPVSRPQLDDLPFEVSASVALDDQAQFDPVAYLRGLARACTAHADTRLHEGSRVTHVGGGRHPVVRTEAGSVRSNHVVVTTLLPILDRGLQFATAEPEGSYTVALEVDGPLPADMLLSADEPSRSLRTLVGPDGRRLLLVGGSGHRVGKGGKAAAHLDELVTWTEAHYEVRRVVARWFAHDLRSVDHLPWAGPLSPLTPAVLGAGGFGKWGMTNATAAAVVLDAQIAGDPTPTWASVFDPHRWSREGARGLARHNGEVAVTLVGGWVRPQRRRTVCTHLGGVCAWNDADGTWDCPLHGSRFRSDGSVLAAPATKPLRHVADPPAATPSEDPG